MEQILEIIGTVIGLIYLWLEYRASIYLWIAGIIMPAIYLVVYYDAGLYADFGINVYYLLAAIYGWIMWKYGKSFKRHIRKNKKKEIVANVTVHITEPETTSYAKEDELPISRMPLHFLLPLILVFIGALLTIAWILIRFTDSSVPWLDSFTTAMSIIGMWMLARKHLEQWLIWIVVDAVSTGLYIYKGLDFTAGLYGLYTIIAIFGYFKWKKLMEYEK